VIGLSRTLALALMLCLAGIGSAAALDYPVRAVKWVVPYPPGGTTDVLARIVSQWPSEKMGQPFLIENKAGGGNNIGVETAKWAKVVVASGAKVE
jgi:tripartite-type tricarboxylate transporter receptor subunit TctC